MVRVVIASDHAAIELKEAIAQELGVLGHKCEDLGAYNEDAVDYPDYAFAVAKTISDAKADFGVLMCGTGIGMSIAANRERQVRAALCSDSFLAEMARRHNNANILVLGAKIISVEDAKECLRVFLSTSFDGGRHEKRIQKLSNYGE